MLPQGTGLRQGVAASKGQCMNSDPEYYDEFTGVFDQCNLATSCMVH
jgi:hypothetical protein